MKIKCSSTNCIFNDNGICINKIIKIEALFSKSKLGTYCESFIYKEKETINNKKDRVNCSGNYCKYNNHGVCVCEEIIVDNGVNNNANFRSETQCNSFELKEYK